jgi:Animal haem peroxidase
MNQPKVTRPHGGVRGNNLSRSSLLFGGPFGRIFRTLPAADYGPNDAASLANLTVLAAAMSSVVDPTDPKDGPDNEESGIPAAYTYFGQFIDHDLTFDPASSLQKQNDPDALVDYRTPRFDMDNIYGRGPDDQPYLYDGDTGKFLLGDELTGAPGQASAHDLPRSGADPARAIIGDPRNDENAIVSQLQGLWHRFHNGIVDANPGWTFTQVQQAVRFHYQWILIHDFLPTIVDPDVLDIVLPGSKGGQPDVQNITLRYFHPRDEAFMPLEFSAAAYRFGHSMVRPGYRLNDNDDTLLAIFGVTPDKDLRGFLKMLPGRAIDWRRFIDLEPLAYGQLPSDGSAQNNLDNKTRLQCAYKIDTSLVNPLSLLPRSISTALDPPPPPAPNPLAELNLKRGWRMRLPTGQSVARAMGLPVPDDSAILIGKFTGEDPTVTIDTIAGGAFAKNCPLWTYILAETVESTVSVAVLTDATKPAGPGNITQKQITTRKLGPVGGTIVAETFLGLLKSDSSSYVTIDPLWQPSLAVNGVFGLREMIKFALAH